MDKKRIVVLTILAALTLTWTSFTGLAEAKNMEKDQTLNARQRAIVPIAAFTANGDLAKLKPALAEGLEAGLTVNEIKEILVQLYAYAGFPRSLNGIHTFMAVLDKRQAEGIKDEMGKETGPTPADLNRNKYGAEVRAKLAGLETDISSAEWQQFAPAIDTFLKEHLFADIFVRDVLNHQERELVTIAALSALPGTEGQLRFHFGAAMNTGFNEAQMKDFISVLDVKVGRKEAESAREVLNAVLDSRK